MTEEQRDRVEKRLLEERGNIQDSLGQLDKRLLEPPGPSDGDLTKYPLHQADQGTDTMEEEKEMLLASQEGRLLYAIDDALRRLYKEPERFGRCEECGGEMDIERLDLVPWARLCAACQTREEAAGTA